MGNVGYLRRVVIRARSPRRYSAAAGPKLPGVKRLLVLHQRAGQTFDHLPATRRDVVHLPAVVGLGEQFGRFRLQARRCQAGVRMARRPPRPHAQPIAERTCLPRARSARGSAPVGDGGARPRPTSPTASPRDRPAPPAPGSGRPRRRRRANRIIHGTWTSSPYSASSHGPSGRCSPNGNPRGRESVSSVSLPAGRPSRNSSMAPRHTYPTASPGRRTIARDAQQSRRDRDRPGAFDRARRRVGRRCGSPSSRYAWRKCQRRVPRRAQAGQVTPQQKRRAGRLQPVDDLRRSSGRSASGRGPRRRLRLPGRIDLDQLVEIHRQRMPGHLRLVGQQGRVSRRPRATVRPVAAAIVRRRRTHRVPPLPVRTVQSFQLRRIHQRPVKDSDWPASRSSAGVSIHAFPYAPEVAGVQPVDNQADGIHAVILAGKALAS